MVRIPESLMAREMLRSLGMGRLARMFLVEKNTINHCTWRSHGDSLVLDSDEARRVFLALLRDHKAKHGIEIYSYCLMGTHPHVLCKATRGQKAFSDFWKSVNWRFARWSNSRTRGRGQVIMERLRSPRIQDGRHQLEVMRYGDLNPVRAKLVRSANEWRWSSFHHYAHGHPDDLVTDAPEYLALGNNATVRRRAYLHLFARPLMAALSLRRSDLVNGPFVGDLAWTAQRLEACGLSPPS